MAVSSANMLSSVLLDVGRSAVYSVYNNGQRMLPWVTPESIAALGDTREHWEAGRGLIIVCCNEVPVL